MGQTTSSSAITLPISRNTNAAHDLSLGLPDECLACVFGNLGCHDRNSCSLVCRRWCNVDSQSRNRLLLVSRFEVSSILSSILSRFGSIAVLSLKCSRKLISIDDQSLSLIPVLLPALKKLKIKGCNQLSDDGLIAFSLHRPNFLTKISFASCGFGARGLISVLSNCHSLRDLTLKRLRVLDSDNTPLTTSSELMKKDYTHCHHQLERLCLKDLHNVRLFIPLLCSSSKSLKTLVVSRSSGNWDLVFETLQQNQQQLRDYSVLCEVQMENVQIGDVGLSAIASCYPGLEVFYLSRTSDCTNDGLSAIASSCRKLRKVHIDVWSRFGSRIINDEGVNSLAARCSELQELVLMGVPVTVASLNTFASNCLGLERVALCNTDSVGDSELALIAAKFFALKKLCIKNCPISSAGIEAIGEGCPSLVKLKVKRCRGITQASVSRLMVQRNELVVSVDAAGPLLFDGESLVAPDNEIITAANGGVGGSRTGYSAVPRTSTTTHLVCGSRSASLFGSRFGNALQLTRRQQHDASQSCNIPSVHLVPNSRVRARR